MADTVVASLDELTPELIRCVCGSRKTVDRAATPIRTRAPDTIPECPSPCICSRGSPRSRANSSAP